MTSFVFVSDMFLEEFSGGAEMTTHAIMAAAPKEYHIMQIRSNKIDSNSISKYKNYHWIICNFSELSSNSKLDICKNLEYSIIEYDYKFCKYRSLELHRKIENSECDCTSRDEGKINLAFYGLAQKIWFMSKKQKNIFLSKVRLLKEEKCEVLSSVFSFGDLRFIDSIKENEKDDTYLIVKARSWVKNFEECRKFASKNNLRCEVVEDLPYHELLIKLSTSKGLVFLPAGADTCPRLVIEAKLLGCDLILNNLVQHKDEKWFSSPESCWEHMKSRTREFWRFYE